MTTTTTIYHFLTKQYITIGPNIFNGTLLL